MRASPGALVIGSNLRALGIARSLGRRGVDTWLLSSPGDDPVARASRFVARTVRVPGDPASVVDALLSAAARSRLDGWTLFPTDDEPAAALARAYGPLAEWFALTSPGWEALRYAYDKRLTQCVAQTTGAPYPWTRYPRNLVEVAELECPFPVILKPNSKPEENRFTRAKAWCVSDRPALMAGWAEAAGLVGPAGVIVQELVPGGGEGQYSFASLCREGTPLASLVARRTRQYPRDFGHSSSLVETVAAPEVERLGRLIVEALRWNGLVEIEFKRDARDGSFKLLDINGRVWTWHALGPRAGVDFPYLAWRMSQGLPIEPVRAQPGVRWVRLATDVPSALGAARAGELSLRGWATSMRRPRQGAVLAWDDPLPSLVDPVMTAWRTIRRRALFRRSETRQSRPPQTQPPRLSSRDRSAATGFARRAPRRPAAAASGHRHTPASGGSVPDSEPRWRFDAP
jgi:D-aspartate ligase